MLWMIVLRYSPSQEKNDIQSGVLLSPLSMTFKTRKTTTIEESEASDTNGNFCPMQSRLSSVTLHMINRRRPNIASASIGTSVC